MPVDDILLRFSPAGLNLLKATLGLVVFGIALDLRVEDFQRVAANPRPAILGLMTQFLLLPAMTFGLVTLIDPIPSIALGMMLVAACPSGNMSNFLTHLAKGDTALSISMSAVSTLAATVMTPLNIAFWGSLHPGAREVLRRVSLEPFEMLATVLMIMALPLTAGMLVARRLPRFAYRLRTPMRVFSLTAFVAFVVIALAINFDYFLDYVGGIAGMVFVHNSAALAIGYAAARLGGLGERERRAVAIEVGIQNSGLGLVLVFNFFEGLGGMAIVTAWWGVWHLVSGLSLARFWRQRSPSPAAA